MIFFTNQWEHHIGWKIPQDSLQHIFLPISFSFKKQNKTKQKQLSPVISAAHSHMAKSSPGQVQLICDQPPPKEKWLPVAFNYQ